MLIKPLLPHNASGFSGILPTTLDSEALYEMAQIAGWFYSFSQQMQVIRHEAISVNAEGISEGFRAQKTQQPVGEFWIQEDVVATTTANRYEVMS